MKPPIFESYAVAREATSTFVFEDLNRPSEEELSSLKARVGITELSFTERSDDAAVRALVHLLKAATTAREAKRTSRDAASTPTTGAEAVRYVHQRIAAMDPAETARVAQAIADYDDAAFCGTLTSAQIRYRYEEEGSMDTMLFDHMVSQGRALREATFARALGEAGTSSPESVTATTGGRFRKRPIAIEAVQHQGPEPLIIKTLEGDMRAEPGDWIITGVKGERYPCKPDIFAASYEAVS
jgi:hypothetical protein